MTQHTYTVEQARALGNADLKKVLDRLHAAELALTLLSWCPSTGNGSDREKALHELWRLWFDLVGYSFVSTEENPELSDSVIAALAQNRDSIRAATLRKFFEPPEGDS